MNPSCCISKPRPGTTTTVEEEQPEIRVEKILDIRRQLGEGRYSIADRLDVVIERIISDLG